MGDYTSRREIYQFEAISCVDYACGIDILGLFLYINGMIYLR